MNTTTPQTILTDNDAAQYLGIGVGTLRASRLNPPRSPGPPYIRYGRAVRYRLADLDAWLESRRIVPAAMREAHQ